MKFFSNVLNFSINHIADVMRVSAKPVSFDAPLDSGDDSGTLLDILEGNDSENTDKGMMQDSMLEDVNRYLRILAPKEIQVIKMFFGIGHSHSMSLDEISIKVQLTRERVRQIKEAALRKLKTNRSNNFLKSYL
jgi:RNA polymerase primary sigma factor